MAKNQAKAAKKTSKKQKNILYSFQAFVLQVILGFLIAGGILGFESVTSYPVTANPIPQTNAMPLLAIDFLNDSSNASASTELSIPITTQLVQSLGEKVTSVSAAITPTPTPDDYCINLPIVMYHHIQPLSIASLLGHAPLTVDSDIFEQQIKYLKENNYYATTAEELVTALMNRQPLPAKSVMITIDDGYDDNYTYAFLMAKKYQFVMNFMIPTELIDKPGYMNWDHLKEMSLNPYAKLYNHTATHAALGLIDKAQITQEISTANQELETRLGLKNTILAYPYGSYSDDAIATAKELGITGAISTDPGREQCLSTIMRLPRVRVGNAPISEYGF